MGMFSFTNEGGKYQIKFYLTERTRKPKVWEFRSNAERERFAKKMRSKISEVERSMLFKKYRKRGKTMAKKRKSTKRSKAAKKGWRTRKRKYGKNGRRG